MDTTHDPEMDPTHADEAELERLREADPSEAPDIAEQIAGGLAAELEGVKTEVPEPESAD